MQIIQHPNEFHIHIPFDHWKDRNLKAVKALSIRRFDYKNKIWVALFDRTYGYGELLE